MKKYHVSKQFTKQRGKLVVVALSSICLFGTALTASALAEVKETLAAFDVSPVQEAIGATSEYIQEGLDAFSQDATQFLDACVDDAIDTSNAAGTLSETAKNNATATEVTAAPTNEAIVVDGDTVTIQGDCTTTDIYNVMRKSGGAGVNATKLHFSNSIVIKTEQTDGSNSPFSRTKLQCITADEDASVSFTPNTGASAPTMIAMFSGCSALESLRGLACWDVSKVTGAKCMSFMFSDCSVLSSLDGIANWEISKVNGQECMRGMFQNCSSLASLDALSAWDVSEVFGSICMKNMFYNCSGLNSLDGIASWNLAKAMASGSGLEYMFDSCNNLSSLTVNPNNGFQLNSYMNIPSTFSTGGNYWWPVKGADKGITTNVLYGASKNTDTYGTRWVRSEENVNPYISDVVPTVTWTTIAKPYTGLNQTIGPDKVEIDGTELKAGADYTVLYTKNTTQENAEVASPVVRDKGAYTAELYLQGKYVAQEDPAYTQTVYVTEPNTVALTFNAAGGTFASTGTDILFLVNNVPGQQLNSVEEPTQDGLFFAGWKDAAGAKVDFPLTIPNADTTYAAIWSTEPAPGPTPPGPTPDPTPEPTPASGADMDILPMTGDTLATSYAIVFICIAGILLMVVVYKRTCRRD